MRLYAAPCRDRTRMAAETFSAAGDTQVCKPPIPTLGGAVVAGQYPQLPVQGCGHIGGVSGRR